MPITQGRETIQELRAAGFSENQAIVLAANPELATQAGFGESTDVFRREIGALEIRLGLRLAEMEARFERALRLQLAAILTAIVGVAGLAIAIMKLFPNSH